MVDDVVAVMSGLQKNPFHPHTIQHHTSSNISSSSTSTIDVAGGMGS